MKGIITKLTGNATAVDTAGTIRKISVGDVVDQSDIITVGLGGTIEIVYDDGEKATCNEAGEVVFARAQMDITDVQAAIAAGADPTKVTEATAAGGAPAAGSLEDGGGHSIVIIDQSNKSGVVTAGFLTKGDSIFFEVPAVEVTGRIKISSLMELNDDHFLPPSNLPTGTNDQPPHTTPTDTPPGVPGSDTNNPPVNPPVNDTTPGGNGNDTTPGGNGNDTTPGGGGDDTTEKEHDNKGHGNNTDGQDDDNPGKGTGGPNADPKDGVDEDEGNIGNQGDDTPGVGGGNKDETPGSGNRPGHDNGSKEKGNEGVGNGEDPPPPGHETNQNDGPGTSPGNPGSKLSADDVFSIYHVPSGLDKSEINTFVVTESDISKVIGNLEIHG